MVISTPRDNNRVPTLLGTLNTDGVTVVSVRVNPANNSLKALDNTTGSSFTAITIKRDNNRVPSMWAVSNADGITPIYVATDSSGNFLIDST